MNHIYRLIWNQALGALVPVAEITRAKGGAGPARRSRPRYRLAPLSGAMLLALGLAAPGSALAAAALSTVQGGSTLEQGATQVALAPPVHPLPTGGQVISGQATIGQSGNTLTINQGSQNAILNWQSFDIGADQTVTFNQPNSASVALNRVLGSDPSAIYGHLDANGQVFLVNPNGIYFARGAQVDVGGIVASTLDISDRDFLSGSYHFAGNSAAGVRNDGSINATKGGYVAFVAADVSNGGSIATPVGTTALGAGGSVDLTLAGNSLLNFRVSSSALGALAQNGGVITTDGGAVILSAQARDALLQTVVNNSGQIQAQTVANHHGTIELLGGDSGTVKVAGTLDASAPNGGDGGHIETSGAHLKVADGATITTKSASGANGNWLIDPQDFTIAASGGDISGATLSTQLGSGNVTIQSSSGGTAGNGDIFVNDTVSWSTNTLTLNAYRNIIINTAMNGSGTAGLALQYGQGSTNGVIGGVTSDYTVNAPVNLASTVSFSTQLGSSGSVINYTIITSLGSAGDASSAPSTLTLQGVAASSLSGNYVLGANIDASATATWNPDGFGGYYGFDPIGDGSGGATFTGRFDGLGHTISNLTTRAHLAFAASLFGYTSNSSIRNIGMVGGSVTGIRYAGGLVGYAIGGTIDNAYATGTVSTTSTNDSAGGLVGVNSGTISNAYATGNVNGTTNTGGLVGQNTGTISNAYATGNVVGDSEVGGLIGLNLGSSAKISNVYASGNVSGNGIRIGGLIGYSSNGSISNAYATGDVSGGSIVGGLLGYMYASTVSNVYATGKVSGSSDVGGLVGGKDALAGTITNGYWDTTTTGKGTNAGFGYLYGTVTGGGGLTTAQLAAALPAGFSSGTWANGDNQTTPYLTSFGWASVSGHVVLGSDSSATPTYFEVATNIDQLQAMDGNLTTNFVLGNDIDASTTAGWNGGAGFNPVGFASSDASGSYKGVFDGLYHTITGLTINRPTEDYVGLFAGVGNTVRNLGLIDNSITGSYAVGGLAGAANSAAISNVFATGDVTGNDQYAGGLIGGGYFTTIEKSYATESVTGVQGVGGLMGYGFGSTISDSYATGDISGTSDRIGGLVGDGFFATIERTYATGKVTGTGSNVGGLVGYAGSATITDSYWDTQISGLSTGAGSYAGTGVSGLTTAQLAGGLPTGFDAAAWANGDNQTTPYLTSFGWAPVGGHVILGSNSSATPTYFDVVTNVDQLQAMDGKLAGNYVLGNDIDASATSIWNGGAGFNPIGSNANQFTGVFDGLGHSISSLTVNRPGTYYVGLFGYSSGTLRDVGLLNSSISGQGLAGALVGRSDGTVEYDYAIGGSVTVAQHGAGGLVGQSSGSIKNSYATDSVAGLNSGVASTAIGGLVGSMLTGSTISNSYATGSVSGAGDVGALVGQNSGTVSTSYWNTDTSGTTAGIGAAYSGATTGGTTGLTSAQMMQQANFTGFDFSSPVWVIYNGHTAPLLNAFLTPLTVTATDQTQTYNGGGFGLLNPTYSVSGADTSGHLFGLGNSYDGAINVGTYSPDLWSDQQGYRITDIGGTLTIAPKALTLSGLTAASKVYDGTTATSVTSWGNLIGIVGSDAVSLVASSTTANFGDANAGTGKTVTVGGLSLSGSAAGNYTLLGTQTTRADITPKALTLSGLTAASKVYDGTTTTSVTTWGSLTGIVGSDAVSLVDSGASAAFADANAGTGKTVTVGGLALGGSAAGNYTLLGAQTTTADITPKALTLSGLTAASKVYDGTTATSVTSWGSLTGIVGSDAVSLVASSTTANFSDANAGTGKTVTVGGLALGGSAAGNYTLLGAQTTRANITPKALTLSGLSASNKVYDGSTTASIIHWGSLTGVVGSDAVSLATSTTTANFADANAGTGKTVTVGGLALSGSAAGNYTLLGTQTTRADITSRPLTASLIGMISKPYDGTATTTLGAGNFQLSGFVAGQGASVTQTKGEYASSAIGSGIAVSAALGAGDFSANAGTLLSNYLLPSSASGLGSITASAAPPSLGGATGTATQNVTWGYAGVNGFALALDPRLQMQRTAPGKSTAVRLLVSADGNPLEQPPCAGHRSIDPFATPTMAAGSCSKIDGATTPDSTAPRSQ
ncbi:YDG domain-containing protein [Dyella ginsengisoli]|uniref:YDG domain-containing protein n=1 Tax=Dyella ginsengisoli TaxID=363848 RepID=UPI000348E51D|nr:YDG domain-containing protein [Dyella ginsengisoli]